MSEFQHYQFKAVNRPLTRDERTEISSWSSRSKVTATQAAFTYHYSDFKKDPVWVVEQYFDLMIYFANWGTRQLIIRLPVNQVEWDKLSSYVFENEDVDSYIHIVKRKDHILIDIYQQDEEGGGWMEEDDYSVDNFVNVRMDILAGDFRSLYMLWVHFAAQVPEDEEVQNGFRVMPPEPEAMVNSDLTDLMEYFGIES